jgi:hypothetical protein
MKTLLVIGAVMGFSATSAFAECEYHKVNAAADVDTTLTTASIQTETKTETPILLKGERLPSEQPAAE